MSDSHFKGWVAHDKDAIGNLKYEQFTPKNWTEDDVEIKIHYSGICASDLHTLRSGWGPTAYPVVVGHEIVGEATKVGKDVKGFKVGDIVGVGAQSGSCEQCKMCHSDKEPYCEKGFIGTYGGKYPDGSKSSGGYADYARVPQHFCIQIPKEVDEAVAAPMMCGGVTVYSPLKQNGVGPGMKVGVVGIGGLGHFAVLFAAAMGAEVTAISHTHSKEKDAMAMGAKHFIASSDDGAFSKHAKSLDLIVCTVNAHDMPMVDYLSLLKTGAKLAVVGVPEEPLPLNLAPLIFNNVSIGGSLIGSPAEIREMLQLVIKSNTKTWLKLWKMEDINEALVDMENGNARYRHVLANEGYYKS